MCVYVCVLSHVQLFATPWDIACQYPLFIKISKQGYVSGLSFPSPGYLPDPGIEPMSPVSPVVTGRFFTTEHQVHLFFLMSSFVINFPLRTIFFAVSHNFSCSVFPFLSRF